MKTERAAQRLRLMSTRTEDEVAGRVGMVREAAEAGGVEQLVRERRVRLAEADIGRKVRAEGGREEVESVHDAVADWRREAADTT